MWHSSGWSVRVCPEVMVLAQRWSNGGGGGIQLYMWEVLCSRLGTRAGQKTEEKAPLSVFGVFFGCHGSLHLRLPADISLASSVFDHGLVPCSCVVLPSPRAQSGVAPLVSIALGPPTLTAKLLLLRSSPVCQLA